MPEGDSLKNLALKLAPALTGRVVRGLSCHDIADRDAATVVGHTIVSVDAKGKNLLIRIDDGRAIHIHLGMRGRVGIERARSALYRPLTTPPQLRIEVDGAVVVGRFVPVIRLLRAGAEQRSPDLAKLGPDLLAEGFDETACLKNLRALGSRSIGEALLVQRALAGIGNVYKSEVLFLEGIDPRTPVRSLDDACLLRLVQRASALLRLNIGRGQRRTRNALAGPRYWVYLRKGHPCMKCHTRIDVVYQGAAPGRSTYFCPRCQRPATSATSSTRVTPPDASSPTDAMRRPVALVDQPTSIARARRSGGAPR